MVLHHQEDVFISIQTDQRETNKRPGSQIEGALNLAIDQRTDINVRRAGQVKDIQSDIGRFIDHLDGFAVLCREA